MSVRQDVRTETLFHLSQLKEQLGRMILGKPEVIDNLLIALLSGGHILMEDVPGVGKTTLAKALAKSISGDFKRVQFTPDLLPTDILWVDRRFLPKHFQMSAVLASALFVAGVVLSAFGVRSIYNFVAQL